MKIGLDLLESRLMKKAVKQWGEPEFQVYGNMDIYEDWDNTPFLLDKIDDVLEECYVTQSMNQHGRVRVAAVKLRIHIALAGEEDTG